jgi:hypothetical protein
MFQLNQIAPMRYVAIILFIIAWATGAISGIVAWILLLLLVDVQIDLKR